MAGYSRKIAREWERKREELRRQRYAPARSPAPHAELKLAPPSLVKVRRISVLVTVYEVYEWLRESVDSILASELPLGWDIEVLIGVDGSRAALEEAKRVADPRVGLVYLPTNVGPYIACNTLMQFARGEFFTRVDADDTVKATRLSRLIAEMSDPTVVAANSRSLVQGSVERETDGTWLYRRSVWEALGGYQAWRCAADTDFSKRARGLGKFAVVPEALYSIRTHDRQLTRAPATGMASQLRAQYRKQLGLKSKIEPQVSPCELGGPLFDFVTASLATIPGRESTLDSVVQSLLPQVDRLNVYLNGHDRVPACLVHPKVHVARSQEHGDRGDAGKFFWSGDVQGYHLVCDDDIVYPPDYAKRLVRAVNEYDQRAVVGFHGTTLLEPFVTYQKSRQTYRFGSALAADVPAQFLGTGVLGYHAAHFRVSASDFEIANMADVWFALLGQKQRFPFVCLAHDEGWLKDLGHYEHSIYAHKARNAQTPLNTAASVDRVCFANWPWQIHPAQKRSPVLYNEKQFWDARYARELDSGAGSRGTEAAWKISQVSRVLRLTDATSVTDIGSGDGHIALTLMREHPEVRYVGFDISELAVAACRKRALPNMLFRVGDLAETALEYPPADVVLCLDVLFHLSTQEKHDAAMAQICRLFRKAAVISAWNRGIIDKYRGRFAQHTFYREIHLPAGIHCDTEPVPGCPEKTLYVLTRR